MDHRRAEIANSLDPAFGLRKLSCDEGCYFFLVGHQWLLARNDGATDQFGNLGIMTFSLNEGTAKAWDIEYRQADNRNSMPFISSDHFMDMIFSGATPGVSASTHTLYGSMAMSPLQTFDITAGKIAHLTMEVDAHQSFRRWMDIQITPAADPLRGWDPSNHQINTSGRAMFAKRAPTRRPRSPSW
jgi:hypothetical protein